MKSTLSYTEMCKGGGFMLRVSLNLACLVLLGLSWSSCSDEPGESLADAAGGTGANSGAASVTYVPTLMPCTSSLDCYSRAQTMAMLGYDDGSKNYELLCDKPNDPGSLGTCALAVNTGVSAQTIYKKPWVQQTLTNIAGYSATASKVIANLTPINPTTPIPTDLVYYDCSLETDKTEYLGPTIQAFEARKISYKPIAKDQASNKINYLWGFVPHNFQNILGGSGLGKIIDLKSVQPSSMMGYSLGPLGQKILFPDSNKVCLRGSLSCPGGGDPSPQGYCPSGTAGWPTKTAPALKTFKRVAPDVVLDATLQPYLNNTNFYPYQLGAGNSLNTATYFPSKPYSYSDYLQPFVRMCTSNKDCSSVSKTSEYYYNVKAPSDGSMKVKIPQIACQREYNAQLGVMNDWGYCRPLVSGPNAASTNETTSTAVAVNVVPCASGWSTSPSDIYYCMYGNNACISNITDASLYPGYADCSGKFLNGTSADCSVDLSGLGESPIKTGLLCDLTKGIDGQQPCIIGLPICSINCSARASKETCEQTVVREAYWKASSGTKGIDGSDFYGSDTCQAKFYNNGAVTSKTANNCFTKNACYWDDTNKCRGTSIAMNFSATLQGQAGTATTQTFTPYGFQSALPAYFRVDSDNYPLESSSLTTLDGPNTPTGTAKTKIDQCSMAAGGALEPMTLECTPSILVPKVGYPGYYMEGKPTQSCNNSDFNVNSPTGYYASTGLPLIKFPSASAQNTYATSTEPDNPYTFCGTTTGTQANEYTPHRAGCGDWTKSTGQCPGCNFPQAFVSKTDAKGDWVTTNIFDACGKATDYVVKDVPGYQFPFCSAVTGLDNAVCLGPISGDFGAVNSGRCLLQCLNDADCGIGSGWFCAPFAATSSDWNNIQDNKAIKVCQQDCSQIDSASCRSQTVKRVCHRNSKPADATYIEVPKIEAPPLSSGGTINVGFAETCKFASNADTPTCHPLWSDKPIPVLEVCHGALEKLDSCNLPTGTPLPNASTTYGNFSYPNNYDPTQQVILPMTYPAMPSCSPGKSTDIGTAPVGCTCSYDCEWDATGTKCTFPSSVSCPSS